MRLFIFSRRAQIRGLDFSLAIIIFSLTITQVLILTDTFISGNRTVIELDQQSELTNTLGIELIESNGYGFGTSNWATVPTPALTSSTWNLGLSTAGQIDPFKLGRLSNWSLSDYALSYDAIRQGLNISVPLSIQVLNQIDLQISSVQNGAAQDLIVNGTVTKLSKPLNQAQVWVYGLNSTGGVAQSYVKTNTEGMFSTDLVYSGPIGADYFNIIGFAKYGESSQDVDVFTYISGGGPAVIPSKTPVSIFSSNNFTQGYAVNTTTDLGAGLDHAKMYAFYPGIATGVLNYTISDLSLSVSNLWSNDTVQIPQSGMVVFAGLGYDNLNNLQNVSIIDFPIALNNQLSASISPSTTPQNTSSSVIIPMLVRDVILQLELTIWEA